MHRDKKIKNVHIVGIGGAGMSAIALLLQSMGYSVTGSDLKASRYTEMLTRKGIKVSIGHSAENIRDSGIVVYSTAIHESNVELVEARKKGLQVLHRSEALSLVTSGREVIAISGTHGKTTTTSLLAFTLRSMGVNAGFLVGGEINEFGTNADLGSDSLFVIEADESDGSFLAFERDHAIFTNLEPEHLDFYRNEKNLLEKAREFISGTKEHVVLCEDDPGLKRIRKNISKPVISYGLSGGNFRIGKYQTDSNGSSFMLFDSEGKEHIFSIKLKGVHNILNSAAVISLLMQLGFAPEEIRRGISGFSGVGRRLEPVGSFENIDIYDDYAHHPTEIKATLSALRKAGCERIVAVFQPHRYTRTAHLFHNFPSAFSDADFIVCTEIYAAGEDPIPGISGKLLFEAIAEKNQDKTLAFIPRLSDIPDFIFSIARKGDAIVFLGAGDISSVASKTAGLFLARGLNTQAI